MQGNDFGDGNVSISHEQLLALTHFVQISAELVLKCRDIHAAHGVASDVAIIATLSSVVNDLDREAGEPFQKRRRVLSGDSLDPAASPVGTGGGLHSLLTSVVGPPHGPTNRLMLSKSRKTADLQTEAALRGLR